MGRSHSQWVRGSYWHLTTLKLTRWTISSRSNNFKVKVKSSLNADSAIPSDKSPKLKLLVDELRDSGLITGGSEITEDLVNVYNLAKI